MGNRRPVGHGKRGGAALALVSRSPLNSNVLLNNDGQIRFSSDIAIKPIACPRKPGPPQDEKRSHIADASNRF